MAPSSSQLNHRCQAAFLFSFSTRGTLPKIPRSSGRERRGSCRIFTDRNPQGGHPRRSGRTQPSTHPRYSTVGTRLGTFSHHRSHPCRPEPTPSDSRELHRRDSEQRREEKRGEKKRGRNMDFEVHSVRVSPLLGRALGSKRHLGFRNAGGLAGGWKVKYEHVGLVCLLCG